MVHFDNENTMIDFCNFFVKGHPESEKIDNDEKNYTTIPPNMVAGECEKFDLIENAPPANYRVKLFFPHSSASEIPRELTTAALKKLLSDTEATETGVISTEIDYCTSGLVPGTDPDNSLIWALCFKDLKDAENFTQLLRSPENLRYLKDLLQGEPRIMISEVMSFDMALTEPYRNL
mgnify:CR=1 FL=1